MSQGALPKQNLTYYRTSSSDLVKLKRFWHTSRQNEKETSHNGEIMFSDLNFKKIFYFPCGFILFFFYLILNVCVYLRISVLTLSWSHWFIHFMAPVGIYSLMTLGTRSPGHTSLSTQLYKGSTWASSGLPLPRPMLI